jgi:hypothetical protein
MRTYEVVQCRIASDRSELDELLSVGWEPFAVTLAPTATCSVYVYHLRRTKSGHRQVNEA